MRQLCPTPIAAYAVGGIGWTFLILYVVHSIYIMRSPQSIPFSLYFYLAPEFSLFFVHAFRAGHYILAPIGVLVGFAYVISSMTTFIILHLSYTYYFCYSVDTPIDDIATVCPHHSLSLTQVLPPIISYRRARIASLCQ